jgi:hypothetical protein
MRTLPSFGSAEARKAEAYDVEGDFNQQQIDEELRIIRNMINKGQLQQIRDLTNEKILEMAKEEYPESQTDAMALANLRTKLDGGGKKRPKNKTKKKRSRKKTKKKSKKKTRKKRSKKN